MSYQDQSFILPKQYRKDRYEADVGHRTSEQWKSEINYINNMYAGTQRGFRALAVHEHNASGLKKSGKYPKCSDCGMDIYKGRFVTVDRWNVKGVMKEYTYCPDCAAGVIGALLHVDTDYINYGVYPYDAFLNFQKKGYTAIDNYLDLLFQPRETNSRLVKLI